MSLESIRVSLRAWRPDGQPIEASVFDRLVLGTGDATRKAAGPGAPRVELLALDAADFARAPEPSEAFAAALREGLARAAAWLAKQPRQVFKELFEAGVTIDIFIGAWIDVDQMDLDLPPAFLEACGERGLAISLITND